MEAKFKVGDAVWVATYEARDKWITCSDCLGHRYLKVTFGDGSEVSIDCAGCSCGYEPPTGKVRTYETVPRVERCTVDGVEVRREWDGLNHMAQYRFVGNCGADEVNVFSAEQEAISRSLVLAAEAEDAEAKRMAGKEKPTHTWARNASYHRKQLKEAERQIDYHTRKLNAAKAHVKEEKAVTA